MSRRLRGSIFGAALLVLCSATAALAAAQWPFGAGTGGCRVFPPSSPWHENVSKLPVSPMSAAYIASIGATLNLHPDFGSNLTYGIP
ncbi:MAG TPA: hypothetical protein VKS25_10265, partial [Solirubrobacteraceae bacterium]|nr:hypothetical protein [Solirubrobacteraceae bacterium]